MRMWLNKSLLLTITTFFILFNIDSYGQINVRGIPFIKNYSPRTYAADEANWAVAKDHRGIMYFGNSEYVLEYDGHAWTKIAIPGQKYIQALATGKNGTIYVGGIDDFGRLVPDKCGKTVYKSLTGLLTDEHIFSLPLPIPFPYRPLQFITNYLHSEPEVSRIRKIYTDEHLIYFCSFSHIFKYNKKNETINTIKLPKTGFYSFFVNEQLYQSNYNNGLMRLESNKMVSVQGGDYYKSQDIFAIMPWKTNLLLISTSKEGLSLFNTQTGEATPFDFNTQAKATNQVIRNKSVYTGTQIDPGQYAFGTYANGIYIINRNGAIINHINKDMGLQDETISNLYYPQDRSGILWATLSNGISVINIKAPVRKFGDETALDGAVQGIAKHNDNYYVATMLGVYKQDESPDRHAYFKPVKNISGEIVYSLLNLSTPAGINKLIAGSLKNLYEIKHESATALQQKDEEIVRLLQSKADSNKVYIGTYNGIKTLRAVQKNLTISDSALALPDKTVTRISEAPNGNLWCNTLSGKYHITPNGKPLKIPERIKNKQGNFFRLKDDIFFVSEGDIYKYYQKSHDFKLYDPLTNHFQKRRQKPEEFFPINDTLVLAHYSRGANYGNTLISKQNDAWNYDTVSLNILPSMPVNTAFADFPLIMIGAQEGLFVYNLDNDKYFSQDYQANIREVMIGNDSVIFKGAQGFLKQKNTDSTYGQYFHAPVDYKYNSITFTYSAGFYEKEEKLKYKSKLHGFDKEWSQWQNDVSRTYTNLKEGSYTFHVKAKNIYGVESNEAEFEFEILPPWYRTWWAYIIYIVVAFFIIRISIKLYTRKLREDKRKLEAIVKERTAEIVEKNKRIEKQNRSITDSIRYAKRIQTAVLPNKQTCNQFEHFIYFRPKDIVSGDFFWVYHFENQQRLIAIAADCTGHGVPGAFMSMLGTSFLNDIVTKFDVNHSEMILNQLRDMVIRTLSQGLSEEDDEERKDGMDIALASIDLENKILEFSGAHNPLILIRNNEVHEYKPDKMPIGAYVKQDIPFRRQEIQLQKGDTFYIFSDGFIDQFGGPNDRKYMKKRFKQLLLSIHSYPMQEQKQILKKEMDEWLGEEKDQIDDQIVIGMRLIE